MIIANSITRSYQVSRDHLNALSVSPDLVTRMPKPVVDTPPHLTSLSRLKIIVANLVVAIIFVIPIIQSIALYILLNHREGLVRKQLEEDPSVNPQHITSLTNQFLDSSPCVHIHQKALNEGIQIFLNSRKRSIKANIPRLIQERIHDVEFADLFNEIKISHSKFSSDYLFPMVKDCYLEKVIAKVRQERFPAVSFLPDNLVLEKINDPCSLERAALEKIIHRFFQEQISFMQGCLEAEIPRRDCQRIFYEEPLAHFTPQRLLPFQTKFHEDYQIFFDWAKKHHEEPVDELSKRTDIPNSLFTPFFLENLSRIHSSAILYERYQTLYPATFSEEHFSFIYSVWEKLPEEKKIANTFLKDQAQKEEDRIFAVLWENRRNLKGLNTPYFFHSPADIQTKINLLTFKCQCVLLLFKNHPTSSKAKNAWNRPINRFQLVSEAQFKEMLCEHFNYKKMITNEIYDNGGDIAKVDYIKKEVSQFESQTTMTLNQFLADLKIRLLIKKTIEQWGKNTSKHDYLLKLIQYHSQLISSQYSPNQLKPLIEELNSETLFHLVALETSPIPVRDLDARGKEILKICRIMRAYIENNEKSIQQVTSSLSQEGFQILTKEEISHLLYLAFICLQTRKCCIQNPEKVNSAMSRKSRSGRSLPSRHITANNIKQILAKTKEILSTNFLELLPSDSIIEADIEIFRKHLIDTNWSPR